MSDFTDLDAIVQLPFGNVTLIIQDSRHYDGEYEFIDIIKR